MNTPQAAAGLGLLSALSWGGSDFTGGVAARKAPALLVVVSGQIVTLTLLLGVCFAFHIPAPGRASVLYALAGGFEGALSLALFYRALAMGAMGLTAALTGVLTALVPVVFAMFHDGLPGPLALCGIIGRPGRYLAHHAFARDERQRERQIFAAGGAADGRTGWRGIWRADDPVQDG